MSGCCIRQNFDPECEAIINKQINLEFHASYAYLAMSCYFGRADVALMGFGKFFERRSDRELERAKELMHYQNIRGGRIVLQDLAKPTDSTAAAEWEERGALNAVEAALKMEKDINAALLHLHEVAAKHDDPHLSDFLEDRFIAEQVESMKMLGDLITMMNRAGKEVGLHIIDTEVAKSP